MAIKALDSDLAIRTAMYFDMDYSMEDAFNLVGVPLDQSDAWDELWSELEANRDSQSENS